MGEKEDVCSKTLKQRFAPAAGFVAAANAVLRGAAEAPAEPESFVSFVHSYSPSSGLSAESFSAPSAEMLAQLARDGCVSRILDLALRAHELFDDEGLMLPTLPVPGPCHPPEQHAVGLSAELVDAALAFILFCAKSEEDQYDEPFFPTLQDVQYPDTVQALMGHFLLPPHQRVTLTRTRVGDGHFTAMLATARVLPRVQFVESGEAQPVRVLFADPCIGGGVLFKKGAQEEALLRKTPSLLAALPLATYLECGVSLSQCQEALVLAAEGGPTLVAIDAARFQVLRPP